MAGDIGIAESLAPLAVAKRAAAPTQILHEYGPTVRVRIGAAPSGRAMAPINEEMLSPNERLGLSALRLRESDNYIAAKQERRYKETSWAQGPTPLHLNEEPIVDTGGEEEEAEDAIPRAPLAKRLSGRIAVGVIMVSGKGKLALTAAQQVKIAAEVQNGLSWLGAQSPAKDVTWVHESQFVSIDAPLASGTPTGDEWEFFEKPWRDAALAKLGYSAGRAGVNAYIRALLAAKSADAAYCAFFTHYPLNHFAYCTGPYLVMDYANDGWGVENLDRVFAHESGHVFGAPDEYRDSRCNCRGSHGFFGRPNLNCEVCAPDGGIECIMKQNSWAMCSVTPYHLGFNGLPTRAPDGLSPHVA